MTQGDLIGKRCFRNRPFDGSSCEGDLRIEAVVPTVSPQQEAAELSDRTTYRVRCDVCGASYLRHSDSNRLQPQ